MTLYLQMWKIHWDIVANYNEVQNVYPNIILQHHKNDFLDTSIFLQKHCKALKARMVTRLY